MSRAAARVHTGSGRRIRATVVLCIAVGIAIQLLALVWAFMHRDGRAPQSEDMVPFTYLLATIASVLAAVMAMAGSVLILSLTLGSSVCARTSDRSFSRTRISGSR